MPLLARRIQLERRESLAGSFLLPMMNEPFCTCAACTSSASVMSSGQNANPDGPVREGTRLQRPGHRTVRTRACGALRAAARGSHSRAVGCSFRTLCMPVEVARLQLWSGAPAPGNLNLKARTRWSRAVPNGHAATQDWHGGSCPGHSAEDPPARESLIAVAQRAQLRLGPESDGGCVRAQCNEGGRFQVGEGRCRGRFERLPLCCGCDFPTGDNTGHGQVRSCLLLCRAEVQENEGHKPACVPPRYRSGALTSAQILVVAG